MIYTTEYAAVDPVYLPYTLLKQRFPLLERAKFCIEPGVLVWAKRAYDQSLLGPGVESLLGKNHKLLPSGEVALVESMDVTLSVLLLFMHAGT